MVCFCRQYSTVLVACSINKIMNRSRLLLNAVFELKAYMSTKSQLPNHYEVLNVTQTSTQDDIKSAYYELTKKYHPDKNTSTEAKVKFQKVSDAYEVLSNFAKRKEYDRDLMARGHRATVLRSTPVDYGIHKTVKVDPLATFYKSRLGNNPETPIYNFDDWTRAHYGRSFKRTLEDKEVRYQRQQQRYEDYRNDMESYKNASSFMLITISSLLFILTIYHEFEKERYDRNRLLTRQKNEEKLESSSN